MSNTEVQQPVSKSKPVRVLGVVLAILVAGQGYMATIDGVPDWVKLVVGGAIILITVGLGAWTESVTVPFKNVAARYIDQTGETVAGPAADPKTGTVVDVTSAGPSPYTPPSSGLPQ